MDVGPARKRQWDDLTLPTDQGETDSPPEHHLPALRHPPGMVHHDRVDRERCSLPPLMTSKPPLSFEEYHVQPPPLSPSGTSGQGSMFHYARQSRDTEEFTHKKPRLDEYQDSRTESRDKSQDMRVASSLRAQRDLERETYISSQFTSRRSSCCSPSCSGTDCLRKRSTFRELAVELTLLESRVQVAFTPASRPQRPIPEFQNIEQALAWALEVVRWNNLNLQEHSSRSTMPQDSVDHRTPARMLHDDIRRRYEDGMETSPSGRGMSRVEFPRLPPPHPLADDPRSSIEHSMNSPHLPPFNASSASHSMAQSPSNLPQSSRTLPSPISLSFPSSQGPPSVSSLGGAPSSAHATHYQELQHQVSVRTLQLQTLQKEYDSLLQKLERQRTKCAILEKKFEVSDVEINDLTNERESLLLQVSKLEAEVENLQNTIRRERKGHTASGTQHMKMLELASQIQVKHAKKEAEWQEEKKELESRIKVYEASNLGSPAVVPSDIEPTTGTTRLSIKGTDTLTPTNSAELRLLRAEVMRLQGRIASLEKALADLAGAHDQIQESAQAMLDKTRSAHALLQAAQDG